MDKKSVIHLFWITAAVLALSGCPQYYSPNFPVPLPPENLQAEPFGSSAILLTWDAVEKAEGYTVYRSDDGEKFTYNSSVNINSFLDTDVVPGVKYFYQLKTIRAHYNYSTEFSQPVSAETDEDFFLTLGTPAVTAAKGNFSRQAVLSWKKIEGASSYTVFAGDSLNSLSRLGKASEGAKHTQISDDGTVSYTAYVPNEQTYYFCVQASGNTGAYSQLSQTVAYDGIKAANTSQTAADPLYFNESQIFCFTAADKPLWFIIENSLPLSGKAELYVECIDTAEPLTVTLFKKNAPDITSSAASSFTLVSTQNIFDSASCELTFSDTNTAETVSYYICIALRNKTALYYDYTVTLREAE